MQPHDITDGSGFAKIPVVTLHDPMTNLPCQVLQPAYEYALRTGTPIIIKLRPHLDASAFVPADAERTPEDEIIAEIIDDHPGLSRVRIEEIAKDRYVELPVGCIKKRMAGGTPLTLEGYHKTGKNRGVRYWPPSK